MNASLELAIAKLAIAEAQPVLVSNRWLSCLTRA